MGEQHCELPWVPVGEESRVYICKLLNRLHNIPVMQAVVTVPILKLGGKLRERCLTQSIYRSVSQTHI